MCINSDVLLFCFLDCWRERLFGALWSTRPGHLRNQSTWSEGKAMASRGTSLTLTRAMAKETAQRSNEGVGGKMGTNRNKGRGGSVGGFFSSQGIQHATLCSRCKTNSTMAFKSACRERWRSTQEARRVGSLSETYDIFQLFYILFLWLIMDNTESGNAGNMTVCHECGAENQAAQTWPFIIHESDNCYDA